MPWRQPQPTTKAQQTYTPEEVNALTLFINLVADRGYTASIIYELSKRPDQASARLVIKAMKKAIDDIKDAIEYDEDGTSDSIIGDVYYAALSLSLMCKIFNDFSEIGDRTLTLWSGIVDKSMQMYYDDLRSLDE